MSVAGAGVGSIGNSMSVGSNRERMAPTWGARIQNKCEHTGEAAASPKNECGGVDWHERQMQTTERQLINSDEVSTTLHCCVAEESPCSLPKYRYSTCYLRRIVCCLYITYLYALFRGRTQLLPAA